MQVYLFISTPKGTEHGHFCQSFKYYKANFSYPYQITIDTNIKEPNHHSNIKSKKSNSKSKPNHPLRFRTLHLTAIFIPHRDDLAISFQGLDPKLSRTSDSLTSSNNYRATTSERLTRENPFPRLRDPFLSLSLSVNRSKQPPRKLTWYIVEAAG